MIKIKLTNQKEAIIDKEDYERVTQFKWCSNRSYKGNIYAVRSEYKNKRWDKPIKVYLHRFILNAPKGSLVDHINRDTLDNRKSNLRLASRLDNLKNSSFYEKQYDTRI